MKNSHINFMAQYAVEATDRRIHTKTSNKTKNKIGEHVAIMFDIAYGAKHTTAAKKREQLTKQVAYYFYTLLELVNSEYILTFSYTFVGGTCSDI